MKMIDILISLVYNIEIFLLNISPFSEKFFFFSRCSYSPESFRDETSITLITFFYLNKHVNDFRL